MPATVHAATTAAERVISDKTAEDILQILWNEFQQEKRAQDFDHKSAFQKLTLHSQFGLMRDFHNFVYKDEDRKRIFDEWLKWQERTGKEPTFAKDIRSPMSTMDHTATGTPQVIPDKSAERIVQTLWTGLNQQMHLPQLPSLDRLDPIIQSYLKSRMLAFVQADQDRTMLFNEWLKTWQHKASSNAAPALDTFSAFMSPTVHGTTAAAKVISDETAKFILLILWREFDGNHLHELYDQRVVDRLDSRILETTKRKFQKFVYEDENRKRIFEEWLKWHEHTSRKKTLAQATTGKKRKVMD
ncbi:hypothetical protein PsorP6_009706 [Peronosclerospora sorghi]|uniref:Uncharacterized protein n=1 Tax=Peronosclerospora sorghi TaxID=230839 RepID=A0ACC0W1G0_9STRA|nr:hypothetical protein PsorP6_009706 [Peronosclerospora sorghi]